MEGHFPRERWVAHRPPPTRPSLPAFVPVAVGARRVRIRQRSASRYGEATSRSRSAGPYPKLRSVSPGSASGFGDRVDENWLTANPLDMRAGLDTVLARGQATRSRASAPCIFFRKSPGQPDEGADSRRDRHLAGRAAIDRFFWLC